MASLIFPILLLNSRLQSPSLLLTCKVGHRVDNFNMKQNVYDKQNFFEAYMSLRSSESGFNELIDTGFFYKKTS